MSVCVEKERMESFSSRSKSGGLPHRTEKSTSFVVKFTRNTHYFRSKNQGDSGFCYYGARRVLLSIGVETRYRLTPIRGESMRFYALLLATAHSSIAFAHPYFPLNEGTATEWDYSFEVKTDRKEFQQANTKGSMKSVAEGWEERDGKKYLRFVTSYEGIPYMKETSTILRREESGAVILAVEVNGKIKETVELPREVAVGTEWNYDDGVASIRKVTDITSFRSPTGETLSDCIEVTRSISGNEALKTVRDRNLYCRDEGNVHSLFVQPSPVGDYQTETTRRGAKR